MSTRQLTDASAQITDTYTYDAFGVLLNRSGSTENNYLYIGEQYDANIGFYYLRARYYNANIGRFLTMDTWPGNRFEPYYLHKYLYSHGNPISNLDPSGMVIVLNPTLLECVAAMVVMAIIVSAIGNVVGGNLLSWIQNKREPVEWSGEIKLVSVGSWILDKFIKIVTPVWGLALIAASLTGTKGTESIDADYTIVATGFSWPAPFSRNSTSVKVKTPGFFGLDPIVLLGPVSWNSTSAVVTDIGIEESSKLSASEFFMGFGHGSSGNTFGFDVSITFLGGWSFPGSIIGPS